VVQGGQAYHNSQWQQDRDYRTGLGVWRIRCRKGRKACATFSFGSVEEDICGFGVCAGIVVGMLWGSDVG